MRFEKTVIGIAENHGIDGAYFYEGTLFFAPDNVCIEMVDRFREDIEALLETQVQFSDVGDEVAVDFMPKEELSPFSTVNS